MDHLSQYGVTGVAGGEERGKDQPQREPITSLCPRCLLLRSKDPNQCCAYVYSAPDCCCSAWRRAAAAVLLDSAK